MTKAGRLSLFYYLSILVVLKLCVPSVCFSKDLKDVEKTLKLVEAKFSLSSEKVDHWRHLYHSVESKVDFDSIDSSLTSCAQEAKELVEPCINFITHTTHAILNHMKVTENTKFAASLFGSKYGAVVGAFGNAEIISPANAEQGARYLRIAQDEGFLDRLNSNQDLMPLLLFLIKPPTSIPKTRKEFEKELFLQPLELGPHVAKLYNIQQPDIDRLLRFIEKDENKFYEFIAGIKDIWSLEYSPSHGPKSFSRIKGIFDYISVANSRSQGTERYLENFKESMDFSHLLRSHGYSHSIRISDTLNLFRSLGYNETDWPELAKELDGSTYKKIENKLNYPHSGDDACEKFKELLGELEKNNHSSSHNSRVIPISKITQLLGNDSSGLKLRSLNKVLSQITKDQSEDLKTLLGQVPLLLLTHHYEKMERRSPDLLEQNPSKWVEELKAWIQNHPGSLNPKVKLSFFEVAEGRWDSLEKALQATLPHSNTDTQKFKQWFAQALGSESEAEIRKLLTRVEDSREPQDKAGLAQLIHHYGSPFLTHYLGRKDALPWGDQLTQFLTQAQNHLKFAESRGLLQRPVITEEDLKGLIQEYDLDQFSKKINLLNVSGSEKKHLYQIINNKILKNPKVLNGYEELFRSTSSPIDPQWILLAEQYPANYVPGLLKHRDQDRAQLIQNLEANSKLRSVNLNLDLDEAITTLMETPQSLDELERHIYEKTSPVPRDKRFYRWGERVHEKGRISGSPFNLDVGNVGGQAFGPGLYLADSPLGSASYGVGKDPYLIEVVLPSDTHLLDLSSVESNAPLWNKIKDDPVIQRAGITESSFLSVIPFLNPKSTVIRASNGYYVFKTSKTGQKETVMKPKFNLDEVKKLNPDINPSKSDHSAVAVHFFKRLLPPKDESSCLEKPKTLLKFDFGLLYHVLEEAPGAPFAIESRDSFKLRKQFRCFVNQDTAVIASGRDERNSSGSFSTTHEVHYSTNAKTCEEMEGTWKKGFVCEGSDSDFRWIDLHAAMKSSQIRETAPLFHNKEDCIQAGNRRNLFWRCLPDSRGDEFSIHAESLFSSANFVPKRSANFPDSLGHGHFDSLQSCLQSLDQMSLGIVCLPNSHGFEMSSLFQHDYVKTHFQSLQECSTAIESQQGPGLRELSHKANTLSSSELVNELSKIPVIRALMAQANTEGGSLEFHSTTVLDNWDEQMKHPGALLKRALAQISKDTSIDQEKINALLRSVIALHDLGKPISHELQHLSTVELVKPVLKKMGFSKHEIELGLALVDQDLIGEFLKNQPNKGAQRALKVQIQSLAKVLGVNPNAWFKLMMEFYTADASFYPALRDSVFGPQSDGSLKVRETLLNDLADKL